MYSFYDIYPDIDKYWHILRFWHIQIQTFTQILNYPHSDKPLSLQKELESGFLNI